MVLNVPGGSSSSWLDQVSAVRSWQRGGVRAPHKPLLLLLALGRLQRTGTTAMPFADVEGCLRDLLREFGPPSSHARPEYPFFHLQSDGLWTLDKVVPVRPRSSPSRRLLLSRDVLGQLTPSFERALKSDPSLFVQVARLLLDRNFPSSLHHEICAEAGLDLDELESRQHLARRAGTPRDAAFRKQVLLAYEYRCAVCSYQGQVAGQFIGLDAAHVRWWAAGGPDTVDNGLCLCTFHHKLLDSGVIGVSGEYRVLVSRQFIAHNPAAEALVFRYGGKELLQPQAGQPRIGHKYLEWHELQVFRGPARTMSS